MELYNEEFVYFDWNDKLEGKEGFLSDSIRYLKEDVKDDRRTRYSKIRKHDGNYPFASEEGICYTFCYYDPYYELRKAYIEGKQLQFKSSTGDWIDVDGEPLLNGDEYRVKPEYRIKPEDDCYEVGIEGKCPKFVIHNVTSTGYHIPTYCFFEGSYNECIKWCDEHEKFIILMAAWERDNVKIEYYDKDTDNWYPAGSPNWDVSTIYRIKSDKHVPFDTLDEFILKWEGMNPGCTNRPKCAMPMIWVKRKRDNTIHLIVNYYPDGMGPRHSDVGIDDENLTFKELFEDYTFINDSIIGKIKENKE